MMMYGHFMITYWRSEFLVLCRSSTVCRFRDDMVQEASICFSSFALAEWDGLLGMPTSTNVSEPDIQIVKVKVMWHTAKYGDPYSEIVLCIYPSMCTHTHSSEHTHTHREHTRGQPFMLRRAGSIRRFGAFLKGNSSWYWRWRGCCTFTPPTYNPCRTETRTHNLSITSPNL